VQEVAAKLDLFMPIHVIDGNAQSMSPEMVDQACQGVLDFDVKHGEDGVVIVDHIDNYFETGENDDLNRERQKMLGSLSMLAERQSPGSRLCVVSDGRMRDNLRGQAPERLQIFPAYFADEHLYQFTGTITTYDVREPRLPETPGSVLREKQQSILDRASAATMASMLNQQQHIYDPK